MNFYRQFAVGVMAMLVLITQSVFAATPVSSGKYWFDCQNELHSFTSGKFDIDVSNLYEGFHTLSIWIEEEGVPTGVASRLFLKTDGIVPGEIHKARLYVDGNLYNTYDIVADDLAILHMEPDFSGLSLGIHHLRAEVVSKGGVVKSVGERCFLRVLTSQENSSFRLFYLIDDISSGEINAASTGNVWHFVPDVSNLSSGLHSLTAFLANPYGVSSSAYTAWFVKIPAGGEGVVSYEYWLNDNASTVSHVDLPEISNPFSLMALLDMPQESIRSSRYTFVLDEEVPTVYALNDFHINFFDADGCFRTESCQFSDTRVKEVINEIKPLEKNGTTNVPSIKENEIRWYSFEGEMGDSISLNLDRAGMYELYSPQAEILLKRQGADATALSTHVLTENGSYYLAVHDVTTPSTVNVVFNHVPRFALLNDTPLYTADGSMLIFDMKGNGFKALKSLSISNGSVEIEAKDFYASDNYQAAVHFDLPKGNDCHGAYDLIGVFNDEEKGTEETVISTQAVNIVDYTPGEIEVLIDHPLRVNVPDEVYIHVTNTSNRGCWGVPVNYAFQKPEGEFAISYKDFYPMSYEDPDGLFPTQYSTDDLLGTGKAGYFFPLHIPYIGPNETVTLSLGLRYDPSETLTMYAWGGQPWSEEFEEILSEDFDFGEILTHEQSNIFSARAICYAYFSYLYEQSLGASSGDLAPVGGKETVHSWIKKCIPEEFRQSHNLASTATNVYTALAQTEAGIINGSRLRGANATLAACGYDPSDPDNPLSDYTDKLKQGMYTPASIVATAAGVAEEYNACENYARNCPKSPNPSTRSVPIQGYRAWDPNEITGYTSPGGTNHIGIDVKTINYMIEFENDPEMANAAAHRIKVTDVLNGDLFDLSSLRMRAVDIGGRTLELEGENSFVKTLDLRPEINAIAQIALDYNQSTGVASWNIVSLDPITLDPTLDVMQGVLPVNYEGSGIGQIFFDIRLRDDLSDGMKVSNKAEIIFDDNDPIVTDTWVNVLDYTRPQSYILNVTSEDQMTFDFEVEGEDYGSGIWLYDLYMRLSDSSDWTLVKAGIEDNQFTYISPDEIVGADFAVIATDKAGNRQDESNLRVLLGDADGNNCVDANDVLIIRNYYMKVPTQINLKNADATRDGVIDAQDALSTRNIYLDPTIKTESNQLKRRK